MERVTRLAATFDKLGTAKDDRVAILSHNSDSYLEYSFAIPWSGRTMVPLNTRLAMPEILYMLEHSEVTALFFDEAFAPKYPELRDKAKTVEHFIYMGDGKAPEGAYDYEDLVASSEPAPDAGRGMDDLLGIYYTGGTTGLPKGVMLTHGNMANNVCNLISNLGFTEESAFLHVAPMFHLADLGPSYCLSLLGGTHHFFPVFDVDNLLRTLEDQKITNTGLVPVMIGWVVNHPKLSDYDLSRLESIIYGSSPIPEAVLKKVLEVFPYVEFYQFYGLTEAAGALTVLRPDNHVFEGPNAGKLRSAGRPAYSLAAKVVDLDGKEVPRGLRGELLFRNLGNMLGYLEDSELTAQTMRDGWLHTGDVGYMDEEGFIFVVDRLKDMIVTGGENVHSSEVEHAIASHPSVAEVAVIGIPSEKWGEQVHAFVVPKPGRSLTEKEILVHCRELIARYKCPKSVEIRAEALPLSGAGKIQKHLLRAPFWERKDRKVN
jgi:long-chain acyl-CoA synthetase